jgi:hypothetical protein
MNFRAILFRNVSNFNFNLFALNRLPDPDIRVCGPRAKGPLGPLPLKAVKNHILRNYDVSEADVGGCIPTEIVHWGKLCFYNGGDTIRGADLVPHSEHNMMRDASFMKVRITQYLRVRTQLSNHLVLT